MGLCPNGVSCGYDEYESVVTITDDDVPAGTVTLVLTPATIDESGTNNVSTVTATLSTASSAVTTITVSVPEDSPVTLSTNTTLTIAHGATSSAGAVTITAVDDAVYTGDREVDVSGAAFNDVGVTDPDDETLTITDDDVLSGQRRASAPPHTPQPRGATQTVTGDPERGPRAERDSTAYSYQPGRRIQHRLQRRHGHGDPRQRRTLSGA